MKRVISVIWLMCSVVVAAAETPVAPIRYLVEWQGGPRAELTAGMGIPVMSIIDITDPHVKCRFRDEKGIAETTISLGPDSGHEILLVADEFVGDGGVKTLISLKSTNREAILGADGAIKTGGCSVPSSRYSSASINTVEVLTWGQFKSYLLPNGVVVKVTAFR